MTTTINAKSTGIGGLDVTCDASGSLELQTGGVAALTIDTSQRTAFVAGTAAAPAITRTGDTNTGMFFPAADTIAFAEGGTEAMRLDSVGNVGIGTSSPGTKLDVRFATNPATDNGIGNNVLRVYTTVTQATDVGGAIGLGGYATTAPDSVSFAQLAGRKENSTSGNYRGYMQFATLDQGGTMSERMRIDSSGNVNIGQSSAFGAGIRTTIKAADTSSQSLALISAVTSGTGTLQYLVDGSNDVCGFIGINATANTTSYNTSSDYRLKENIVPMTGALDKVQALKPVFWNWKHAPEIIGQGFIAHELQAVIPDAVSGEKDAVDEEGNPKYQGIDTSFLVATLTAAIQEQQTIINDLKARIETLEGAKS